MEHFIFILILTVMLANLSTGNIPRQCNKEGYMCKDCKTLVYCKKVGYTFQQSAVMSCGTLPCDDNVNACSPGGTCRYYKEFTCPFDLRNPMALPDPYSCTVYWRCSPSAPAYPTPIVCPPPSSYNPVTQLCNLLVDTNPLCTQNPLPPCQYSGQKLTMKGTSYSYDCIATIEASNNFFTLYPYLRDSTDPITPFECKAEGLFPFPGDCYKFYRCTKQPGGTFLKTEETCRIGSFFDSTSNRCKPGDCTYVRH